LAKRAGSDAARDDAVNHLVAGQLWLSQAYGRRQAYQLLQRWADKVLASELCDDDAA
jgi:hypothetical protein